MPVAGGAVLQVDLSHIPALDKKGYHYDMAVRIGAEGKGRRLYEYTGGSK